MKIKFEYPLATEENMKAIQDAIKAGTDVETLFSMFDEEMLWDCYIVMSGQQDVAWHVFDWQNGNEQFRIEDWEQEGIESYFQEKADCVTRSYLC